MDIGHDARNGLVHERVALQSPAEGEAETRCACASVEESDTGQRHAPQAFKGVAHDDALKLAAAAVTGLHNFL